MKKTKEVKKVKKVKKVEKVEKAKKAESQVCPFGKEVMTLTIAHRKLFLAVANECKSRVRTMATMYAIHASLTNIEFEECNKIFESDQT